MKIIYKGSNGRIVNGDNLDVLKKLPENFAHSCVSDFPYGIGFMGKDWDTGKGFYEWCYPRAVELLRVLKPGGFVAVFGHAKRNHRMKCAFEDAGFNIVEEIDWVFMSGMPKNQDLGKLIDKAAGVEREVIGIDESKLRPNRRSQRGGGERVLAGGFSSDNGATITAPATDLAKEWDGWKTAGLKPAHEPITIFQKPLEGTYVNNIKLHGCGGMNIEACRVPIKNSEEGRFPPNIIMDEHTAMLFDAQTGVTKSTGGSGEASRNKRAKQVYGGFNENTNADYINESLGGYGDSGGGSRLFPIIYTPKVSKSERKLSDGSKNPHVTLKPVALIKWLIRLLTPLQGVTIDITAGSCTHGVAAEELNRDAGYTLTWLDVELQNSEEEPYCEVGRKRVEAIFE